MREDALRRLFAISLKARILRAWQQASEGGQRLLSEREILALEFVQEFSAYSPVAEGDISKVLGLSPSSASDLLGRLSRAGLVRKLADEKGHTRNKPLQVTKQGIAELDRVKRAGAARFAYLFSDFTTEKDWDEVVEFLGRVDGAATKAIRKNVFGEYDLDFLGEDG